MADEQNPEMIRRQMQVQRASLDQKLDSLENRIVETVEGAREAVAETIQTVRESVQSSVETVKDTVQSSVETVKETFDIKRQVDRHPWAMFGGSVALGFAAGWLLNRASNGSRATGPAWGYPPASYTGATSRFREEPRAAPAFTEAPAPTPPQEARAFPPAPPPGKSWLDELSQKFAPEIEKAKGLAIGAALSVVRDMVTQAVPDQLRPQVNEVMNGITAKLGGQPLQGDLLESLMPREHEPHPNGHHRQQEEVRS